MDPIENLSPGCLLPDLLVWNPSFFRSMFTVSPSSYFLSFSPLISKTPFFFPVPFCGPITRRTHVCRFRPYAVCPRRSFISFLK